MSSRTVHRWYPAQATSDGAGVAIQRAIGQPALREIDPFLLLDEIRSEEAADYIKGFPPHPHRGFDTVTYMITGSMRHRDSRGHEGVIHSGGLQWMSAGSGIVHSETPEQEDGLLWGFQLWLNLPAADKMSPPRYADFADEQVPRVALAGGGEARVLAGDLSGESGPVQRPDLAFRWLDVTLPGAGVAGFPAEVDRTTVLYVLEGALRVGGGDPVKARHVVVLGEGDEVQIEAGAEGTRFLLLSARAIGEPIERYGPFVMNTRQELQQAALDFQAGRLG